MFKFTLLGIEFNKSRTKCKNNYSEKMAKKLTPQQKKFKKATQICKKKKGNYRSCMKRELKK